MGVRIDNPEVLRLITDVANAMGVTKTEAVRQCLQESYDKVMAGKESLDLKKEIET